MGEKPTEYKIKVSKNTIIIGVVLGLSLIWIGYLFGARDRTEPVETQINEPFEFDYSQIEEQIEVLLKTQVAAQLERNHIRNTEDQWALLETELVELNDQLAEQALTLANLTEQVQRQQVIPIIQVPDHIEVISSKLASGETGQLAVVEVEPNDTVWSIARRFQMPVTSEFVNQIIGYNQITPSSLQVGTKIMIPLPASK